MFRADTEVCPYGGYNEYMTDHVTVEKLNLEEVGRYFDNLGYKVKKLEQPWRHVMGEVLFENEKLFLKLASTPGIGERTANEAAWNKNANTVWKKYISTFKTPKMFDEGFCEGKYWFIDEFVFGKPLIELKQQKSDISEVDLITAAEIAKNILEITDLCMLAKDRGHLRATWKNRIMDISREWSINTKTDTSKLLRYIEEHRNDVEIGACHGDFTPWAIMKTKKNEYYLIDSEAAQMGGLKYYDVAYFYHRVYTKLKRPDLAKIFLEKFKEMINWTENDEVAFRPVLASRIMGGYFDGERDRVTSMELNKELETNLMDS